MRYRENFVLYVIAGFVMSLGYVLELSIGLVGSMLFASGLALLSFTILLTMLSKKSREDLKSKTNKDKLIVLGIIIFSLILLVLGVRNVVFGGLDIVQGPTNVQLRECNVISTRSRRGLISRCYLTGIGSEGEVRKFQITHDYYLEYSDKYDFSVSTSVWEYSEFIKEIYK